MKNIFTRRVTSIALVAAVSVIGLAGCANAKETPSAASTSESSESTMEASATQSAEMSATGSAEDPRLAASVCGTSKDDGSNHEIPIGDADQGPFHMEANYFQPGYMMMDGMMMPAYKDSIAHIELDVKANQEGTNYGWSVDETPADLNISYTITDEAGKTVAEGKFMEMNAGDGSHYGTNIPQSAEAAGLVGSLDKPGKFNVIFHVAPPTHYGLHIDKRTGVKAREWFKEFDVKMPFLYTAEQKKCIEDNPVAN